MSSSSSTTAWLLGPRADVLLIANAAWPLVAAFLWLNQRALHTGLDLYLMYVIGTPHRWLTPGLVANDKERLAARWPALLFTGAATAAVFFAIWLKTRDIGLLIMLAYLWNLWHVVAQHAGVVRIYSVAGQPEKRTSGALEKYLLRTFMLYAFLRVGSLGIDFQNAVPLLGWIARFSIDKGVYDAPFLLIPAYIAIREVRGYDPRLKGKYVHLTSVLANFTAMIVLCHYRLQAWALAVATANALFHATEYFGIVTWSVQRRADPARAWFLPALMKNWTLTLVVFLYAVASLSLVLVTRRPYFWMMANTLVACLHYAYDGVLWKMPVMFKPRVPVPSPVPVAGV
ncbi:MAG TPA: hypothetical protein VH309_09660 [Elusimicrobiota bacterium]|jgi:hypothetical protein|nr:hypothetical protein [Elusimicrobiota bacterium]